MTETRLNERPRYHRIKLAAQLGATIDGHRGIVLDISLSGVLVAHQTPFTVGSKVMIHFEWKGDPIEVESKVVRTAVHKKAPKPGDRPIFRSGLAFGRWLGKSESVVRAMTADLVSRALDEQKANARGVPAIAAWSYQTGKKSAAGFLTLRLVGGSWKRSSAALELEQGHPLQPTDGFTVSADEDPAQIELLCQAYASGSYEDRKMLRNMAALSISSEDGVSTRRYEP